MKDEKEDAMEIRQYIFKSPYSSPIQFGQLDPSSVKKEDSGDTDTAKESKQLLQSSNETLLKAKVEENRLKKDVAPQVQSSNALLDVYA
jgi:hypothetical protein